MSESHTPGPWFADGDSVFTRAELQDGGDIVCMDPTAWGFSDSGSRWAHNARLIAAAPDLLEALQRLFEDCQICAIRVRPTNPIEQAQAAIAKATGQAA